MINKQYLSFLVSFVSVLVVGGGAYGAYVYLQPSVENTQGVQVQPEQNVATPPSADAFIEQSAREMLNPIAAIRMQSTSTATGGGSVELKLIQPQALPLIPPKNFSCLEEAPTYSCFEDYYGYLVREKGVAAAFTDLKARYEKNTYVMAMCHPFTHAIGNAAAVMYGDVGTAYTKGDSFCWSGYYHGVMEGIVGKISKETLGATIQDICSKVPGKDTYSFDFYNCVHGLGHGVMVITENELFESLKLCDGFIRDWDRQSCYSGVFMENVMVDNRDHFTKYLKPSDPLYPCNAVDTQYKSSCYLMQTSYMLKVSGGDFVKAFASCKGAEDQFRATCYQSVGRDASGRSSSDMTLTRERCALGTDHEQRANCIVGAVKDFISYFHSDVQAKQLCDSLAVEVQEICRTTAETYYKTL